MGKLNARKRLVWIARWIDGFQCVCVLCIHLTRHMLTGVIYVQKLYEMGIVYNLTWNLKSECGSNT